VDIRAGCCDRYLDINEEEQEDISKNCAMMSFMMFHLEGFWELRNTYSILVGQPKGKKLLGEYRSYWGVSEGYIQSRVERAL